MTFGGPHGLAGDESRRFTAARWRNIMSLVSKASPQTSSHSRLVRARWELSSSTPTDCSVLDASLAPKTHIGSTCSGVKGFLILYLSESIKWIGYQSFFPPSKLKFCTPGCVEVSGIISLLSIIYLPPPPCRWKVEFLELHSRSA